MKNDTLLELQDIVHTISSHTRVSSSKGIEEARRVIRKFLKKMGLPFIEEGFSVEKNLPIEGKVEASGKWVKAYPFVGCVWGEREGEVVGENEDVKGKIALVEVGRRRETDSVRELKERGCIGAIFYLDELISPYIGNVSEEPFMAVSVDRETAKALLGARVKLKAKVRRENVRGKNLYFDIGKGPFMYIIAHLDTKPFVKGALDNAVAVSILLLLARELKDSYHYPYRLRFLFTDGEELGLEGAKHHVRNLKYTEYVINVDSIGWSNPAVIYKDARGYNGERIMEKFYKHLKEIKIDIPFREGRRGLSDHVPFKEKGVQTLFLSSNPFTLRHTFYDTYEAIDWGSVEMWFDVLLSFIRRFPKL